MITKTEQAVITVLKDWYNTKEFTEGDVEKTTLMGLGLDSLDIVEVVMQLEDTFDIEITDEEVEQHINNSTSTVRGIAALIDQRKQPEA